MALPDRFLMNRRRFLLAAGASSAAIRAATSPDFPLLAAIKPAILAEIGASMKDWMNL
jgi:hypothetical protein